MARIALALVVVVKKKKKNSTRLLFRFHFLMFTSDSIQIGNQRSIEDINLLTSLYLLDYAVVQAAFCADVYFAV